MLEGEGFSEAYVRAHMELDDYRPQIMSLFVYCGAGVANGRDPTFSITLIISSLQGAIDCLDNIGICHH